MRPAPFNRKSALLLCAFLLLPLAASAQSEVRMNILAVNDGLDEVLVKLQDADQGTLIQIRQVGSEKVKKSWFTENRNDERKRIKRLKRKFKHTANVDQTDETGRHTVMGAPDKLKKDYDILIMRDGRVGVLGSIPIKTDESGRNKAKAMLKEVVWAPGGKSLFVIVNQKLDTANGVQDVDEMHYFTFRPWKVKWIKPDGAEGSEESGDGG